MKERYEIIKKIYPDYLILFKSKDKTKYYGDDEEIIEIFGIDKLNRVNKIVLNNLEIEIKEEYQNNEYDLYYTKMKLINFLNNF